MRCRGYFSGRPALLFLAVAALLPAPRASAQSVIRIVVLNGKTGEPITHECLNIFVPGRPRWTTLILPTDQNGVVTVPLSPPGTGDRRREATAGACSGLATPDARLPAGGTFQLSGDLYVACQEYRSPPSGRVPRDREFPDYSVAEILRAGLVSSNTCGKVRVKAKPGELIFFERPMTFWEKLRE